MPTEPYRETDGFEREVIGSNSTSTGGTIPPATQPVSPYPGLVYRSGFWYDAARDQWYDQNFQKLSGDPTRSTPGPFFPGTTYPVKVDAGLGGTPVFPGTDPGDGPIPGVTNAPRNNTIPSMPTSGPGSVSYLGAANPWAQQAPHQLANPMPGRPQIGTAPMQAYQSWALRQGQSQGAGEPFTPWGFPVGQVSQIRGYGGSPSVSSQGGYAGTPGGSGPALPPITTGGGWTGSWTGSGGGAGPGGGGLQGRGATTGGTGYTPPPGGGGAGLPGRIDQDEVVSTVGGITRGQMDELLRMRTRNTADQPADINPLTVNQLRLLLATQGAVLRGY